MGKHKTLAMVMLTTVLAYGSYSSVSAADDRDVVRSGNGNVVVNTYGKCVRTQWEEGNDACAPRAVSETVQVPVNPIRQEIDQEARTVYFAFNQDRLTPEAKQKLDTLANVLKSADDVKEVRIFGYADRIGTTQYNDRLSKKRAEAVRHYIISRGFAKARVTATRWFGEKGAIKTSCAADLPRKALIQCLQKDRRVEVELDYLSDVKPSE